VARLKLASKQRSSEVDWARHLGWSVTAPDASLCVLVHMGLPGPFFFPFPPSVDLGPRVSFTFFTVAGSFF